jgi:hypothetical protein
MRKQQQQQILDLLQTIREAQSSALYADCQGGALSIGSFIEDIEGEGIRTVALLEEYCELLFKASNGEIGEKPLRKQLIKIENSIKSELSPNKTEMVFLSYNASMSDAIESIYLAAKSDPSCDAFWIPIPYFEKKNDGSLGAMRYEGAACYGDNIACTDWREYDIEARRPDAVFSFAPYDAGNRVTSVHPDFYFERLRNLTDCLVYVPYFVAVDDVQDHFCTVAGCVFAHKVILQSEKIRNTYIRAFKGQYGGRFGRPEDKFLALGSPKFDKTLHTKREDCKLPGKWRKLIGDKKVIFRNTTIGAILQGDEQYLKKLRCVIDTFRGRDDVVLWWRPHPLNEATYRSMRPGLLAEYEWIIAEYRRAGFGIYDDTADLHRAIAWTDAYYGDISSLIPLYGVVEKPIWGCDVSVNGSIGCNLERFLRNDNNIGLLNIVPESPEIAWSYSIFFNALLQIDLKEHTAEVVYSGKGAGLIHSYLYACGVGEEVVLAPYYSDRLCIYDKERKTAESILLDSKYVSEDEYGCGYKLGFAVKMGSKVLMFGHTSGMILAYDTDLRTVTYNNAIAHNIATFLKPKNSFETGELRLIRVLSATKLWFNPTNSDALVEYDLSGDNCRLIGRFKELQNCETYRFDGEVIWVIPSDHKELIRWDFVNGTAERYSAFPSGCNTATENRFFISIADCDSYLILLPAYGNMAVRHDKRTGQMTEFDMLPVPKDEKCEIYKYDSFTQIGNSILFTSRWDRNIYAYDLTAGTVSRYDIKISDADYRKYLLTVFAVNESGGKHKRTVIFDSWYSADPVNAIAVYLTEADAGKSKPYPMFKNQAGITDGNSGNLIYEMVRNAMLK